MIEFKTIGPACTLGEGPLWHPLRQQLFWFDIPAGTLYCCNDSGEVGQTWQFGEPASAAAWIDDNFLLVATASSLKRLDLVSGAQTLLADMESDSLSRIIGSMSIPNATCFSPDGRAAFVADTTAQIIWRWTLGSSGRPVGERTVHIDLRAENANPDGAVCDAEGYLWNAQYGSSRIVRYAPDGTEDRMVELPVSQPTCPAFGGPELKTLYITSAYENLSPERLACEADAGKIIVVDVDVPGIPEHRINLG